MLFLFSKKKDLGSQFVPVVIGMGEFIRSLVLCWMKQLLSSPHIAVSFKVSDVCQRIILKKERKKNKQ